MAHVPKFGNWEGGDQVPYTVYFEKARKDKNTGGKMINPNDPQENPEAFDSAAPVRHDRAGSRGESDLLRPTYSPAHVDAGTKKVTESPLHPKQAGRPASGDPVRKPNGGSDNPDQSPLHPHYQARVANKGGISSPSWERRGSSEGGHGVAPLTPGRSKTRSSARADDSLDKGAAVPKFGAWDEANPSSADGYTHIFNKVREERHVGTTKAPMISSENPAAYSYKPPSNGGSSMWCCFGGKRSNCSRDEMR